MNKILPFFIFLMCITAVSVDAQHATVVYNYERNYFNENQPLPSETHFLLNGAASSEVTMVHIELYRHKGKENRKPLFVTDWKRPYNNNDGVFSVPVNFKLRSNSKYDVKLDYYRNLTAAEREYLKVRLFQTLDAYLTSSLQVNKNSIKLLKHRRQITKDIDSIVEDGLQIYRNRTGLAFEGFSDVVKEQLIQIEKASLKQGKFMFGKKKKESKAMYANKLVSDLQKVVHNETEQYLNSDLMTILDTKYVDDYASLKQKGAISLNVGYGGVYFDGDFDDLDYDAAPYIGVSLPFGNSTFSKFFGNASLSAGIFVQNMENEKGEKVTGPLVKRPIYLALGYRFFKFIRLNAGATLLEVERTSNDTDIQIRPFVGLSAEINLSVSVGDK